MANKLFLYGRDGLHDVVWTRGFYMLLSLFRRVGINKKLALPAIAGVGAKDGVRSHDSEEMDLSARTEEQ